MDNYVELTRIWLREEPIQVLLLGDERMTSKASYLETKLGSTAINITGKTTLREAFGMLQHSSMMISEDSGLMHMAWVSGVPTIALFGGSRHQWSAPMGDHSRSFDSGDLPCGACMERTCRFGDVHCLTRITPQMVFDKACEVRRFGERAQRQQ